MRTWRQARADDVEKLRRIEAITDAALSALDLEDLLAELLDRTTEILAVDTAAIMLVDPAGQDLVTTAARGLDEEVRQGVRVPIGQGFIGQIAATRQPMTIDHVDEETVHSQILIDKQLAVMTGVPMLAADRLIGVLHVGSLTAREFSHDDVELLRLVADRASLATEARLRRFDRAATLALQRSLVPARLPAVAGLDAAGRYVPGAEVGVGGDWYDLFELQSRRVGVVIGDVAGSGLLAAVVMGRIRSALRAYALETDDPAEVLTRLDRKIQKFEPDAMATVQYAVINQSQNRVAVASAGHLPPLIIGNGGGRMGDVPPDAPLGIQAGAKRRNAVIHLADDAALLLYADGLVERRDQLLIDGIKRLIAAVAGVGTPDQLCNRALSLLRDEDAADDVAMIAVARSAEHPLAASG